jgi:hypothetical protein
MNETADLYRRWARVAARNLSPAYERLALAVAEDDAVVTLLEKVEIDKRQPNLVGARNLATLRDLLIFVDGSAEPVTRSLRCCFLVLMRLPKKQFNSPHRPA